MATTPKGRRSGFRLLDGVVVAAVALLALKVLALMAAERSNSDEPGERPELPAFARVLAHARTNYEPPDVTTTGSTGAPPKEAKVEPPPVDMLPPPSPPASNTERALLEKLGERRDELKQRASEAEQREKLLEENEKRLDQRLEELKALQQKAEGSTQKKTDDNEAVTNLVVMYETMKPKDAAKIFDRLPQSVLVPVVTQMKPKKMSEILAVMSPASAEKLTVALATRGRDGQPPPASTLPAGELPAIEPQPRR